MDHEEFPWDADLYDQVTRLLSEAVEVVSTQVTTAWQADDFHPKHLLSAAVSLILTVRADLATWLSQQPQYIARRHESVRSAMELLSQILILVLKTKVTNEDSVEYDVENYHLCGVRASARDTVNAWNCGGQAQVTLPPELLSWQPGDHGNQDVFQILASFGSNPFPQSGLVTSQLSTVLLTQPDGSEIRVRDLPENQPISISLTKASSQNDQDANSGVRTRRKRAVSREGGDNSLLTDPDEAVISFSTVYLEPGKIQRTLLNLTSELQTSRLGLVIQCGQIPSEDNKDRRKDWNSTVALYFARDYVPHKFDYDYTASISCSGDMDGLQYMHILVPYR